VETNINLNKVLIFPTTLTKCLSQLSTADLRQLVKITQLLTDLAPLI